MRLPWILTWPFVAGACLNAPQESPAPGAERAPRPGPARIGFSMDTLKEERWTRDKQLVEQRAREAGAVLDIQVANGDDAVQTKQCENMLTKGVDVLIVAPHNGEIAASIVEAAHRKGVPVIAYDRMIRNCEVDLHVAHQQEKIGVALQRIVRGKQAMTIYTPIQPLAFGAVDAAIKLARKEPIEAPERINNGKIKVPSILYDAIVVDKSNVDTTVIKDGYHRRQDIYEGVTQ